MYSFLDKNDAVTPNDLKASFHSSYTPSPKVLDLLGVWDVKQWMRDCIEDIHTHTRPHHYRFRLVDGQAEIKYKYWSSDPKWLPSDMSEFMRKIQRTKRKKKRNA